MKTSFMRFILIVLSFMVSYGAMAQLSKFKRPNPNDPNAETVVDTLERIRMVGRYDGTNIMLKWAPLNEELWRKSNRNGYKLLRFSFDTLGNNSGGFVALHADTIRPWLKSKFESYLKQSTIDDNVAIVAQCIYGKSDPSKYQQWTDQIDEAQNKYAFTLLASEFSNNASEAAGLYFHDKNIEKNKFYTYRLIRINTETSPYDTTDFYINTYEFEPLPKPYIQNKFEGDGRITLYWQKSLHLPYYTSYYIEKSLDGKNFVRQNKRPYQRLISESLPLNPDEINWTDTSAQNGKTQYYRIIGLNSFGELSPPSDIITAIPKDKTPPKQPFKVSATYLGGSKIKLTWEYDGKDADMAGFMIGRSRKSNEGFDNISGEKPIDKSKRSWIDENCLETSTNFYIVAAVDNAGNASASLISYAAILDTIPPSKPYGLEGSIDTNGVVTMKWRLGKEPDIKGYYVYYSHGKDHVLINKTTSLVIDTMWTDTINLWTLTKDIYFAVQAIDRMSNGSVLSDRVRFIKPDIAPPVQPILKDYKVDLGEVTLKWQPSTSPDVSHHVIYRKKPEQSKWETIATIRDLKTTTYLDTKLEEGTRYTYGMQAIDSTGNASNMSDTLSIKTFRNLSNPITQFQAVVDTVGQQITLRWNDESSANYKKIILYKAVNKGPVLSLVKLEAKPGKKNEYIDKRYKPGDTYEYATKVVYVNGSTSQFSPLTKAVLSSGKR
ncbi:MAG: fibronectin type III domain-containing protein [Saprospiraceae bacterium]|nr:fibronectin type III domain-containing protein [Saprospiraceae bacterium]